MADYECKEFADIGKCFQKLHIYINTEVEKLKEKQEQIDERVKVLENAGSFANGELHDIHNSKIPNLESLIAEEANERLKLEVWGRKWNLVIRGIEGKVGESPKVTENIVRIWLHNDKKGLGFTAPQVKGMLFTAVHRLPNGPEKKRNIILRLSNLIDRDDILSAATKNCLGGADTVWYRTSHPLQLVAVNSWQREARCPMRKKENFRLVYLKDPPFVQLVKKRS
ncbi:Hypothetical predicted protein [Mytilus galloprovincialis]|uniref:Uncharacterized protein n=1 Tax=Mytilus galloprovincialis TaxID=29158 RepID=A0A8B6GHH6_MYTGA|nr:Hypothetical predicted protein [Mytilus galloprovincialis]